MPEKESRETMEARDLKVNDVVQLSPECDKFAGCFMVITEPKSRRVGERRGMCKSLVVVKHTFALHGIGWNT